MEKDVVCVAAIIEARLDLDSKAHLAADHQHTPDQAMPVRRAACALDRHEVLDLADAFFGEKACDEHVRVWQVQLLGLPATEHGCDAVVPAARAVENSSKNTRRIEAGAAVPIDGAVGADQRYSVQVADDAVLGNRQV